MKRATNPYSMRALLVALLAGLPSCGSFSTTTIPTDAATSTPPDSGDASSPADGSPPAADASTACVKRPPFSDGFERSNGAIFDGWSGFTVRYGTLAIDEIGPLSGRASLKVDLSATNDGAALLERQLPSDSTCPVRVGFLYKPSAFPPNGGKLALARVFYDGGELEVRVGDEQMLFLKDDADAGGKNLPVPFKLKILERVELSFVFDTKTRTVSYSLTRPATAAVTGSVTFDTNYGIAKKVVVGADNVQTAAPFAHFLDDIVIE